MILKASLNVVEADEQLLDDPGAERVFTSPRNDSYAHRSQDGRRSSYRPGGLNSCLPPHNRIVLEDRRRRSQGVGRGE